jgi:hypothetical protein
MLTLLFSLRDCFRARAVLQAEILALRHQLLVLQRSSAGRRLRLRWAGYFARREEVNIEEKGTTRSACDLRFRLTPPMLYPMYPLRSLLSCNKLLRNVMN